MLIREANPDDLADTLEVERRAFGRDDEAELVRALIADRAADPQLSLLAFEDGACVGHAMFTSVSIVGAEWPVPSVILAPLAVVPEAQGKGCGTQLIATGLVLLRAAAIEHLFVFGRPDFYTRFGFEPAGRLGLHPPHPIPAKHADAWMVTALGDAAIGSVTGRVKCADSLSAPELWQV
jgi:putative acetyltransferase